ncbi:hypothetical protein [Bradyrhizobium diazoefficiens]|jgi:hypothetical protein|uniref:hypothetical protein n=1 Tax=Bradyrhizobium diazoefficiens TaxID=1355477 RepID=UPI0027144B2F|nr:hypothetical protein [Bradyrhizobium diazoefficiens]WLB34850.1 hypothetical protein QIH78_25550 [Bradyrhizobium diazoefficiens]BCF44583.1 hypothetical protein XF16B_50730 [Bradyrhizobium diazoefficiens]BCF70729.1 hypothetical protein XF19B_50820 [Bradyrhizobium diazoefficiens]
MRSSPSIAPAVERDIYMVLDDYCQPLGRAWPEMDEAHTERETLLRHLMEGQYHNPVRIVCFNPGAGWSQDASDEIAVELRQRCADRDEVPPSLETFLAGHGQGAPTQLLLL